MMLLAFSLFDIKASMFTTPFFMNHPSMAIRAVTDLVADANTTPGRHPEDFILYQVGYFNDANGVFETTTHNHMGILTNFVSRKRSEEEQVL